MLKPCSEILAANPNGTTLLLHVLTKPFSMDAMARRIRELLEED